MLTCTPADPRFPGRRLQRDLREARRDTPLANRSAPAMAVSLDERGPESRGTSYFHSRSVSAIDSLSSGIRTAPLHTLAGAPGAAHICVARVWLRLQQTEYLPGRNARFARTGSVVRLMPARASNPGCGADAQARRCEAHGLRRDRRCCNGNGPAAVGGTHPAIVRQVPENHAAVTPSG